MTKVEKSWVTRNKINIFIWNIIHKYYYLRVRKYYNEGTFVRTNEGKYVNITLRFIRTFVPSSEGMILRTKVRMKVRMKVFHILDFKQVEPVLQTKHQVPPSFIFNQESIQVTHPWTDHPSPTPCPESIHISLKYSDGNLGTSVSTTNCLALIV